MAIIGFLKDVLCELDELDDFRKDSPTVMELKRHILRAILELEMAQTGRLSAESLPTQRPKQPGSARPAPEGTAKAGGDGKD